MTGIAKALETIADIKDLSVDAVGAVKAATRGPFGIPALLTAMLKLASDVKELVVDAPAALPELRDVDAVEAGKLAEAAYDCVKAVVVAVAA